MKVEKRINNIMKIRLVDLKELLDGIEIEIYYAEDNIITPPLSKEVIKHIIAYDLMVGYVTKIERSPDYLGVLRVTVEDNYDE